jgi:hypothetical protein
MPLCFAQWQVTYHSVYTQGQVNLRFAFPVAFLRAQKCSRARGIGGQNRKFLLSSQPQLGNATPLARSRFARAKEVGRL